MRRDHSGSTYTKAVGERLRAARNDRGLSLGQVEAESGGHFKAVVIGSWERGDRVPRVDKLARVAAFYGVPVVSLLPLDPVQDGTAGRPEDQMGITYRQLDHWTRQGYLRPAEPTPGTGKAREWPAEEIAVGHRMGRLIAAGFTPERAAQFAREGWPAAEIAPGIRIEVAS